MKTKFFLLCCAVLGVSSFSSAVSAANWQGFYVGGQLGYATGTTKADDNGILSTGIDYKGEALGITLGYGFNFNKIVVGAEGDYALANVSGSGDGGAGWGCGTSDICTFKLKQLGTLRVRVGYDLGNILPYGTVGLALGKTSGELSGCPPAGWCGEDTTSGLIYGAGAEYAFNAHLSAKGEILHADLGTATYGVGNGGSGFQADWKFNTIRAGVNYRF